MLRELEAWLRTKNESAADSLLEAFEELLTLHRLKVPALLRKTLMSTNPTCLCGARRQVESMFSLVRHRERNITRTRGSTLLQRWVGTMLLYCEQQCKRVNGCAGIAQVIATIETEHVEPPSAPTKKLRETTMGAAQIISTDFLTIFQTIAVMDRYDHERVRRGAFSERMLCPLGYESGSRGKPLVQIGHHSGWRRVSIPRSRKSGSVTSEPQRSIQISQPEEA